jgi:hypothetical protein
LVLEISELIGYTVSETISVPLILNMLESE